MLINTIGTVRGAARSRAPLRLGFAGGGTDVPPYCDQFGGCVLNATINMFAYAYVSHRDDQRIVFESSDRNQRIAFKITDDISNTGELLLHRGVYNRIVKEFYNGRQFAATVRTFSDAPEGSGLGSSSAVVTALVESFKELLGLPLGEYDVARLAYEIERVDLRLAGGQQDQYAAAFGGVNFMEFHGTDHVIVNPLRIKQSALNELEASLLLHFTGISRDSATIINEQTSNLTASNTVSLDAMHKLKADAYGMKDALLRGNLFSFAKKIGESWEAKKKLSSLVSNATIDQAMGCALSAGAIAGKVSGAGGGGFIMFFVDPSRKHAVAQALRTLKGSTLTNVQFHPRGSESWKASIEA